MFCDIYVQSVCVCVCMSVHVHVIEWVYDGSVCVYTCGHWFLCIQTSILEWVCTCTFISGVYDVLCVKYIVCVCVHAWVYVNAYVYASVKLFNFYHVLLFVFF